MDLLTVEKFKNFTPLAYRFRKVACSEKVRYTKNLYASKETKT
jgi:hypothetical protein